MDFNETFQTLIDAFITVFFEVLRDSFSEIFTFLELLEQFVGG